MDAEESGRSAPEKNINNYRYVIMIPVQLKLKFLSSGDYLWKARFRLWGSHNRKLSNYEGRIDKEDSTGISTETTFQYGSLFPFTSMNKEGTILTIKLGT